MLLFETALLLVLACGKQVGDVQALSVNSAYIEFMADDWLTPRRGYTPKVLSTTFRAQVTTLQAFKPTQPRRESPIVFTWRGFYMSAYMSAFDAMSRD